MICLLKYRLQGYAAIEPFIPIETKLYTEEEVNAIYEYFKEKNWLVSEMGETSGLCITPKNNPSFSARTEEGRKQLMYISAFNPYNYERLCAFT